MLCAKSPHSSFGVSERKRERERESDFKSYLKFLNFGKSEILKYEQRQELKTEA